MFQALQKTKPSVRLRRVLTTGAPAFIRALSTVSIPVNIAPTVTPAQTKSDPSSIFQLRPQRAKLVRKRQVREFTRALWMSLPLNALAVHSAVTLYDLRLAGPALAFNVVLSLIAVARSRDVAMADVLEVRYLGKQPFNTAAVEVPLPPHTLGQILLPSGKAVRDDAQGPAVAASLIADSAPALVPLPRSAALGPAPNGVHSDGTVETYQFSTSGVFRGAKSPWRFTIQAPDIYCKTETDGNVSIAAMQYEPLKFRVKPGDSVDDPRFHRMCHIGFYNYNRAVQRSLT